MQQGNLQYGTLVHRVMAANYPEWVKPRRMSPIPPGGRIRVGYVTNSFQRNSVLALAAGWLTQRRSERIEQYAYYIGGETDVDHVTREIQQACDHFRRGETLEEICNLVLADDLHILVFIDVGMYGMMTLLAGLRLAPIQCQTWAHPITSGSPVMDYFFSNDFMEPPDADQHYNERLIRMPGIGSYLEKPVIPRSLLSRNREWFGLGDERTVYLCTQSSFKYLPQHDHVLVEIAQKNPTAQFAFLAMNETVGDDLSDRLQRSFSRQGF
jgi:predicted O-linked N-acetylglucosamine transferase (SPINDLY family)